MRTLTNHRQSILHLSTIFSEIFIVLILFCSVRQPGFASQEQEKGASYHDSDSNSLFQFTSGGHIIGFQSVGLYIASADHALEIGFCGANKVKPTSKAGAFFNQDHTKRADPLDTVVYRNLWNGVTLLYERRNDSILKSTYFIEHSSQFAENLVSKIRLTYNRPLALDDEGNLLIQYPAGLVKEAAPIAWQVKEGVHIPVDVSFKSINEHTIGFQVGEYDPNHILIIDPALTWNTFMGSAGIDSANGIAVDVFGNVYVTGHSDSAVWGGTPVTAHSGSFDAFAVKLNSAGARLWYTFMGSAGFDSAHGIAVDNFGGVYVAGYSSGTWSPSPVTAHAGGFDAFAVKLNGATGTLSWNTFMGSFGTDLAFGIALDSSRNVYVTGHSDSAVWGGTPVTAHAGSVDAFAVKLNSAGTRLWYTFMGSTATDYASDIAVDNSGNVYISGTSADTWGPSPVTAHAGGFDAFAAKLNGANGTLLWNTFMGSFGTDWAHAIALDNVGHVYVAGESDASWGISPMNPYKGSSDGFAAMLMNSSGAFIWHTFMGSNSADGARDIAVDNFGEVYLTGFSDNAWGAPITAHSGGDDAFVTKLGTSGAGLWNLFLGSNSVDRGFSLALDPSGDVYVAGDSYATWGAPKTLFMGSDDGFAAKITVSTASQIPTFSEWGMIVFTILLCLSALYTLHRKRTIELE